MKRILFLLFCLPVLASAQNKTLVIEGVSPGLYLNHTSAREENFYSIGRMYNISPKEIAPFNNIELEKGLSLNQALKIPLTAGNFLQSGDAAEGEVLIPVKHVVKDKESLYRISVNYNKVSTDLLKQWNNLKSDAVSNGTSLIVGYLKVKKELSPLAGSAAVKPADKVVAAVQETPKEIVKNDPPPPPPVKVAEPVKTPEPVIEPPVVKVEKKEVPAEVKPAEPLQSAATAVDFNGGAFKSDYQQQAKGKEAASENGTAAVFKSTSGWQDGKYYCLHNSIEPGTIVKITNTSTGKSVFAKVLDTMPDIKQNSGITIRISNAAASVLGAGEAKFECTINYSK